MPPVKTDLHKRFDDLQGRVKQLEQAESERPDNRTRELLVGLARRISRLERALSHHPKLSVKRRSQRT